MSTHEARAVRAGYNRATFPDNNITSFGEPA